MPIAIPTHDATRAVKPTRQPPTAADNARTMTRTSSVSTSELCPPEPSVCQETGVRHHAMVRAYGLALDMPRTVQHLDGFRQRERRSCQRVAQMRNLHDRRRVGDKDPARSQCAFG